MNIGIIGVGGRSKPYTILPSLLDADTKVTALSRRDPVKLREYAETYFTEENMPKLYTDYKDMVNDPDIDAIALCTPDDTHRAMTTEILRAGKHILLEKPFATTLEDCYELYQESIKHDKVLKLAFVLRYSPGYMKAKEIVDSGVLGTIVNVEASERLSKYHSMSYYRRWNRFKEASGGFLNAKCSHDMDIICWLLGAEPEYLSCFSGSNYFKPKAEAGQRCSDCKIAYECKQNFFTYEKQMSWFNAKEDLCPFNVENDLVDHATMNIHFDSDVDVAYTVTMFSGTPGRTVTVFGSDATLTLNQDYDEGYMVTVDYIDPQDKEVYTFDKTLAEKYQFKYSEADKMITKYFINAVKGKPVDGCLNDARAGLLSSGMALAADISAAEKRVVNMTEIFEGKI